MYINKAQIIGNLTRDPELKALPNGNKVANFYVATNRTWKDQNGAKQEAVDYHNVVFYGKQAEVIAQYMKKGSQIYVEGRLTTRSWEDDAGKKQYRTEIVGENFQFGVKQQTNNETKPQRNTFEDYEPTPEEIKARHPLGQDYPVEGDEGVDNPEDIPF